MVTPTFLRWIATLLHFAAVAATILVLAGLVGFLTDEVRDGSKAGSTRIALLGNGGQPRIVDITQPDPPADVERVREQQHTKAREAIDDAGDVVMTPFAWLESGRKAWVQRLIDSGLALLLYGVVGLFLADRARRFADDTRRRMVTAAHARAAVERGAAGTVAWPV